MDDYPTAYLTAAAAIGMTMADVDTLCERLEATIARFMHRANKSAGHPTS
jgi:hypothetical protein